VKISVVIPAFNEEKLLGDSLKSIRAAMEAFVARGWETELIVCDNNSTDGTATIARGAGAVVVFEPVNQIAKARNRGASVATGDWLVFVDADSHPGRDLFEDVAAEIEAGRVIAGGSTVYMPTPHLMARVLCAMWNRVSRFKRWVAGSFLFCRTDAFREIRGFDETLFASEEIDLSIRLNVLARKRRSRMIILHRHPLTTSDRKLQLYSKWEMISFMLRVVFFGGSALRDRQKCYHWYDGRR
jgi:glycosyltransferase involved in cell wall biosynthesis